MQRHMRFLQSLCGLRRAADCGRAPGAPARSGPRQEDSAVMAESLCQLLGCVVAAALCRTAAAADPPTPPLPPGDLVLEACRVLAGAADAGGLHGQPGSAAEVEGSLRELVEELLHADRLGKGAVSGDHLTEVLALLGESRLLRPLLVRHLLFLLRGLAQRLCHLCQVEVHAEPAEDVLHLHENSFFLFWLLEKLLQPRAEGAPRDPEGPQDRDVFQGPQRGGPGLPGPQEREAFLGLLGSRVLLLSDEFPLFALYMWRVGALLSWS